MEPQLGECDRLERGDVVQSVDDQHRRKMSKLKGSVATRPLPATAMERGYMPQALTWTFDSRYGSRKEEESGRLETN